MASGGSGSSGGKVATNKTKDKYTPVGFSVPYTVTVPVSGGGGALNTAVAAAAPGTRLQIQDSLIYDPVGVSSCSNLTIEALPGKTPSIKNSAPSHSAPGWVLGLIGVIDGFAIRNISILGNGNANASSSLDDGLINLRPDTVLGCTAADRIIIEDCTFSEDGTNNADSGPAIQMTGTDGLSHKRVWIHRCTFSNNANGAAATLNGYGACTITGFGNVYIQGCEAIRTDAVVSRAASNMRGYIYHNLSTIIEDCLAFDLGTGGPCENFNQVDVYPGFDTAAGPSSLRNCVAYRPHRGYRMETAGQTMTVLECVADVDLAGVLAGQVLMKQTAGTLVVQNCILTGAGDGTTFDPTVTENNNDVFNFGATGKVLDPTDQTIDPMYQNTSHNNYTTTSPVLQVAGSDSGPMGVRYGETVPWISS